MRSRLTIVALVACGKTHAGSTPVDAPHATDAAIDALIDAAVARCIAKTSRSPRR